MIIPTPLGVGIFYGVKNSDSPLPIGLSKDKKWKQKTIIRKICIKTPVFETNPPCTIFFILYIEYGF